MKWSHPNEWKCHYLSWFILRYIPGFDSAFQCCNDTETMEPTEELSPEAVEFCKQLGSQATTMSDIIGGKDKEVYRAVQEGIDRVNSAAVSNAQRIQKWTILKKDFSVSGGELGNSGRKCFTNYFETVEL